MTTTLTAHGPEDLLAAVPVVLGFRPEESLVMLTFGGVRSFHARLDLPPPGDADALDEVVGALLAPCRSHEVDHVAFVAYTADPTLAAGLASALVPAFVADGIGIVDVLRAHAGRWCSVPIRAGAPEPPLAPYDETGHPFSAQAVFEGRVTHASRDALRDLLAPRPDLRERWRGLLMRLPAQAPADLAAAVDVVAQLVATGAHPDDDQAVQVLQAVQKVEVRDAAIGAVTGETVHDHLRVWAALLRGAPDPQVPDTAAVLAFCAWQAGDGALAWCALDRCFEVDPDHLLGACLAECLVRALPPSAWEEVVVDEGRHRRSA